MATIRGMTKTQKKWQERVAEWRRSGETSVQFCEGKDFSPSGLRHWAWRLERLDVSTPKSKDSTPSESSEQPRLVRVVTKPSVEAHDHALIPGDTPSHSPGSELVIEVGVVRIGVRRGFDTSTLSSVLDVLEARGGRR